VVREIAPAVQGIELDDQAGLDARLIALDGTPNKSRLGANALLGVSLALAHAAAAERGEPLFVHLNRLWHDQVDPAGKALARLEPTMPLPMVNMISGGLHAGGNLDIQDVLIVPVSAQSYSEALEMIVAIYRAVGAVLKERGFESSLVGDEGGYGPRLRSNEQAFEIVVDAMIACGFEPRRDMAIAVDVASTHFFDPAREVYVLRANGDQALDSQGMIDLMAAWIEHYPIVSIEDGLAEDDWEGWAALTKRFGDSVQLVGDDLFATQVARLRLGIERQAGNAVLIKLNQVGTLTETLGALRLAHEHGFRAVVSARSGETEDTTIADLAVATAAGQIKIGSVARSERLAKYNRLLRIEEELGSQAHFAGPTPA
jgi:enolase